MYRTRKERKRMKTKLWILRTVGWGGLAASIILGFRFSPWIIPVAIVTMIALYWSQDVRDDIRSI